jgi:hypothetical protein
MPIVYVGGLSFCSLVWTFTLLPVKDAETSIWHARPLAITFLRPVYGLVEGQDVLSGFCCGVNEIFNLLGCYTL